MQIANFSVTDILAKLKIDALNDMQKAALEANKNGGDMVLLSATGSGKTLAFLLPLLDLYNPEITRTTQSLIIVPSRELAQQIENVIRSMGTGLKVTCCYGGHLRETEENNLLEPPTIIVGTPGRLADHIRRSNITTATIETLVLDEFDKTLDLGFQEEVSEIIAALPNIKKRILTSATHAVEIPEFLNLQEPTELNFLVEGEGQERLVIKTVHSDNKDKVETLFNLLCYLGNRPSIVFCNHRESVERTSKMLTEMGVQNEFYHGSMEQKERDVALSKFRNGSVNFLVTTDLAARGLDIPFIRYIIHFHLPHTEDSFVHRNGRTARMEASGTAILILSEDEKMPNYIGESEPIELEGPYPLPDKPQWTTFFIGAGKKDKVNKVDIMGFFGNKGELKKEDIGLIDVKDFFSFVAIRRSKASTVLNLIQDHKIKNKKVKIDIAK
jgi:superfamily II DNA/RNA helicase